MSHDLFIPFSSSSENSQLPLVVFEVGFSERGSCCGVWSSERQKENNTQYRLALPVIAEELNRHLKQDATPLLIMEAPLFGGFTARGNPMARTSFEKKEKRRWYCQPAATTCLAVQETISYLRKTLSGPVFIAEAMVTGCEAKAKGQTHWQEARMIFDHYFNAKIEAVTCEEARPLPGTFSFDVPPEIRRFGGE